MSLSELINNKFNVLAKNVYDDGDDTSDSSNFGDIISHFSIYESKKRWCLYYLHNLGLYDKIYDVDYFDKVKNIVDVSNVNTFNDLDDSFSKTLNLFYDFPGEFDVDDYFICVLNNDFESFLSDYGLKDKSFCKISFRNLFINMFNNLFKFDNKYFFDYYTVYSNFIEFGCLFEDIDDDVLFFTKDINKIKLIRFYRLRYLDLNDLKNIGFSVINF